MAKPIRRPTAMYIVLDLTFTFCSCLFSKSFVAPKRIMRTYDVVICYKPFAYSFNSSTPTTAITEQGEGCFRFLNSPRHSRQMHYELSEFASLRNTGILSLFISNTSKYFIAVPVRYKRVFLSESIVPSFPSLFRAAREEAASGQA